MSRKQTLTQRDKHNKYNNHNNNNHNNNFHYNDNSSQVKLVTNHKQRRRTVESNAAATTKVGNGSSGQFRKQWGYLTAALVDIATVPFLFLLLPQIVKNFRNMSLGQAHELAVLSWMGYLTALLGNTLLLSYFVSKQEMGASIIQAIGVASNMAVITQLYIAGYMPSNVFWCVAALEGMMAIISIAKASGQISDISNSFSNRIYSWWQTALGMLGLSVLPQVLATTLLQINSVLPLIISASSSFILMIMDKTGRLPNNMQSLWNAISAWTATLLFCCTPIVQLISNFSDTSSLSGLSKLTILLAMSGNGLMIPRALFIGDLPWTVGSTWGTILMGWGQLLSLLMGNCLQLNQFLYLTCGLLVYIIWVLYCTQKARKSLH